MKIAVCGSPNYAYFRAILRNLAELHHRVTLCELEGVDAIDADVIIQAAAGANDAALARELIAKRRPRQLAILWDADAPATLQRLTDPTEPFRALVPQFDLVFTCGGGDPVVARYRSFGARECIPIYGALDPTTHHRVAPRAEFRADLSFLGRRLPDREARIDEFFFRAASLLPARRFLLGGSGWEDKPMPASVRYSGDVAPGDVNAFHCTPRATLTVAREGLAANGWYPPASLFQAAGAAACVISDPWEGIECFLEPGSEVLVAHSGDEVAEIVRGLDAKRAAAIGKAALRRLLAQHTYAHRAAQLDQILTMAAPHPARAERVREAGVRGAGRTGVTYAPRK